MKLSNYLLILTRIDFCLLILLCCFSSISKAAIDKAHSDLTLSDANASEQIYIVDPNTNKPIAFTVEYYRATTGLIDSHVKTTGAAPGRTARCLPHDHVLTEFTSDEQDGSDLYWDTRFWKGTKTSRASSSALDSTTCHEYALTTSTATTGNYNYWMVLPTSAIGDDTINRGTNSTAVDANDILNYGGTHSTLVTSTRTR